MTTLLLLLACLLVGLLLHALILWGIAKLCRVERATFSRALAIVVVLLFTGSGILMGSGALRKAMPDQTLAISLLQLMVSLALFWVLAWLILRASAGKAVGVMIGHAAASALLGVGAYFGLTQLVRAYVVPTNAMAPTIIGYHFRTKGQMCVGQRREARAASGSGRS